MGLIDDIATFQFHNGTIKTAGSSPQLNAPS